MYILVKDKACRFLISCLLYKAYRDDCDANSRYELLGLWSLEKIVAKVIT